MPHSLPKRPKLVGAFIRERREELAISQRALGLLFTPPVTTQFISNVERGVTPLPPVHVPVLAKALKTNETEIMALLEKEYTFKLSGRLGFIQEATLNTPPQMAIAADHYDFIQKFYEAFRLADHQTRQSFVNLCETTLKI
ncbi:hypothetical protein WDW37_06495 [Bdellovibrionota bacterium FG-1]